VNITFTGKAGKGNKKLATVVWSQLGWLTGWCSCKL